MSKRNYFDESELAELSEVRGRVPQAENQDEGEDAVPGRPTNTDRETVAPPDTSQPIEWEAYSPGSFNPEFSGYNAAHYCTGNPELGWCLYSRGAGGCWNQRTKQQRAPIAGYEPQRIDGKWFWVDRDGESFDDYLPLSAVRTAPGEYDIMSSNGRRLWFMGGASLADWVCASVNGYDGTLRAMSQKDIEAAAALKAERDNDRDAYRRRLENAFLMVYDLAGIDATPLPEALPESAYVPGYMDKVRELREVFALASKSAAQTAPRGNRDVSPHGRASTSDINSPNARHCAVCTARHGKAIFHLPPICSSESASEVQAAYIKGLKDAVKEMTQHDHDCGESDSSKEAEHLINIVRGLIPSSEPQDTSATKG